MIPEAIMVCDPDTYFPMQRGDRVDRMAAVATATYRSGNPRYEAPIIPGYDASPDHFEYWFNDSLSLGDVYDFTGTQSFSVEAIVKLDAYNSSSGSIIFSKRATSNTDGWTLEMGNPQLIRFGRTVSSSSIMAFVTGGPSAGGVRHVVGTYDGTNSRIYVNGYLSGVSASDTRSLPGNTSVLRIGEHSLIGSVWGGSIMDVAIYSRELKPAEIAQHAQHVYAPAQKFSDLWSIAALLGDDVFPYVGAGYYPS